MEQLTWLKDFGLVGAFAGFILYVARLFGSYIDKRDHESREWMDRFFLKQQEIGTYRMQSGMDHLDRLSDAISALSRTTEELAVSMRHHDLEAAKRHEVVMEFFQREKKEG